MRQVMVSWFLVAALVATGAATTSSESSEVLLGWSTDGERYAVLVTEMEQQALIVRERNKTVASFHDGDKGVPAGTEDKAGVERIDIRTWAPVKQYALERIGQAARTRFKAELELVAAGRRLGSAGFDAMTCKQASWTLRRKADKQVIHEVKAKRGECFRVLGGYLHANGKHALVKLTTTAVRTGEDDTSDSTETSFVLVDLPRRP